MHFSLIAVCGLLTAAIAAPTANSKRHAVHERRERLPSQWKRNAKIHGDSTLPMRIALTQSNLDRADEFLMDVSHPESPNYGKHWSAKKVAETFAPSQESYSSVLDWLAEHEISAKHIKQSQSLSWLHFNVTVSEAEGLLNTQYFEYKHTTTGQVHLACEEYSLPEDLKNHIDFVTPTVHFDAKLENPKKRRTLNEDEIAIAKRQISATGHNVVPGIGHSIGSPGDKSLPKSGGKISNLITELENCDVSIVPDCLRALYEFPPNFPASSKNSYGIVEYTPQAYLPSDLDMFFRNFSPSQVGERPIFDSIDGGLLRTEVESFDYNGESVKVTLYQVGDLLEGASFNNFLDAIDGSYCTYDGGDDPTQDGICPDPYGTRDGDYGVAGNGGECIDPATGEYNNGTSGMFNPSFPGTCPYITSVGATHVKPGASVTQPEEAAESVIYSGVGFFNVFGVPSYQASAIKTYFAEHKPPYTSAQYNTSETSRGLPDVSANGVNYVIAIDGEFDYVFGTSASSPTFGSAMTLINAARLNVGKSSVGFINPTIYKYPQIFKDITSGGNQGCGTPGFTAVSGWDPVTGLGTPNFPKMLATWLLLP
ncbi:hypothetical protein N431DRAFT_517109 [Stipitochalara longipes BDJ]|nr:hypothetical protein N431DRAFT_517109 [Stipitochalara longipes BDJ]